MSYSDTNVRGCLLLSRQAPKNDLKILYVHTYIFSWSLELAVFLFATPAADLLPAFCMLNLSSKSETERRTEEPPPSDEEGDTEEGEPSLKRRWPDEERRRSRRGWGLLLLLLGVLPAESREWGPPP